MQREQSEDLKTCFTFWKRMYYDLKAHKGFANGIEKLIPNVIADLAQVPEGKYIMFTGHSFGGALATLLAVAHKPNELCTFGAPRVAGPELSDYLDGVEYHRIVTSSDLVRWLPPNIPFINYKHVGVRRVLQVPFYWTPKKFIHPHLLVTYLNALLEEENLN
jgi:predicted lipase